VPPGLPNGVDPYTVIPPALIYDDAELTAWEGMHHIADLMSTLF
jgi:hypothetical protein